jgi:formylglycine-generating enzyme required for sulfatase activity
VTFDEWDGCVAHGGCPVEGVAGANFGRGRQPVINVSWHDAKKYVVWLSKRTGKTYRLLTEAEWEYAARGTTKATELSQPYSTGPNIKSYQANYDANFMWGKGAIPGLYRQKTVDTGTLPRNAFGLHEMHGNVWEWVEDCYKDSYAGAPSDGSAVTAGACSLRILRGGAWNYHPQLLRSAYRYATAPTVRLENAGLRVARGL